MPKSSQSIADSNSKADATATCSRFRPEMTFVKRDAMPRAWKKRSVILIWFYTFCLRDRTAILPRRKERSSAQSRAAPMVPGQPCQKLLIYVKGLCQKIYAGAPPLPLTLPTFVPFFDLFFLFWIPFFLAFRASHVDPKGV